MASEFVRKVKGIRNIDILSPNITTENDLISTIDGEVYVATNKGYKKITGVETKEIKQLKTDVLNLKIQSDTNTLTISDLTGDIETNTSEIETLKTDTDNNTSEIETLKSSTENNTSEIETLKTDTDNNTSEIETLKSSTENNTSEIETLKTDTENNTSEIETLKTDTENNTSEIETLKTDTDNNTSEIDDLKTRINNYKVLLFNGSASNTDDIIKLNASYQEFTDLRIKVYRTGGNEIFNFDAENNDGFSINYTNIFNDNSGGKLYEMLLSKKSPTELEITSQRSIELNGKSSNNSGITILKVWGVK